MRHPNPWESISKALNRLIISRNFVTLHLTINSMAMSKILKVNITRRIKNELASGLTVAAAAYKLGFQSEVCHPEQE